MIEYSLRLVSAILSYLQNQYLKPQLGIRCTMAKTTIVFGILLIGVGLFAYFGSSPKIDLQQSDVAQSEVTSSGGKKLPITALIPAFFGTPLLICGLIALSEKYVAHAMHAAASVGLLGSLGGLSNSIRGILKESPNYRAVSYSFIMGVICTVFVVLCVRSFIQARRRRQSVNVSEAKA